MPLSNNVNSEEEIKEIINKNIATSFSTNHLFAELLKLNGCSSWKTGSMGSKIRKQLLNEAKNGYLTPDTVMPRAYELIGEYLKISDVKTFEDLGVKNNEERSLMQQKKNQEGLLNQKKIEEKFGIDLTNKKWFKCNIEEVKYSTISNQPERNFDNAYVVVSEDNFEIFKESYWIKSNMGSRKIFFDNITSIDYDARGKFHLSSGIIINTKGAEHIQLKYVTKEHFDLMNNAFESHFNKTQKLQQTPHQTISTTSDADELLKYAELYEKGLLTKEEFDNKKQELFNSNQTLSEDIDINQETELKPKFCPNCGTSIDVDSKFCTNCGSKLNL